MSSLILGVLESVYSGILGNRGDAWTFAKFCRLRDNLAQLNPDANHDLQRALHAAYWQAVLQVCAMRAEQLGVNADVFLARDKLADVL